LGRGTSLRPEEEASDAKRGEGWVCAFPKKGPVTISGKKLILEGGEEEKERGSWQGRGGKRKPNNTSKKRIEGLSIRGYIKRDTGATGRAPKGHTV